MNRGFLRVNIPTEKMVYIEDLPSKIYVVLYEIFSDNIYYIAYSTYQGWYNLILIIIR